MTRHSRARIDLAATAIRLSETRSLWQPLVRYDPVSRYYTRLAAEPDFEAWLLTWVPGQGTDWHDHGGSAGAFLTLQGTLTERHASVAPGRAPTIDRGSRRLTAGALRQFGTRHIHQVTNLDLEPAVSLHVYAPALNQMNDYEEAGGNALRLVTSRIAGGELVSIQLAPRRRLLAKRAPRPARRSIDDVLAEARSRLVRLSPSEAATAHRRGAVVVDIRPAEQRAREGDLPGAVLIERNVLEWRFDPRSEAALPISHYDLQVIVLCQEGYTSSLAAAALQDLGVHRATDVTGGYAAWRDSSVGPLT